MLGYSGRDGWQDLAWAAHVGAMRAQELDQLRNVMKTLEEFVREYDYDSGRFDFTLNDGDSESENSEPSAISSLN